MKVKEWTKLTGYDNMAVWAELVPAVDILMKEEKLHSRSETLEMLLNFWYKNKVMSRRLDQSTLPFISERVAKLEVQIGMIKESIEEIRKEFEEIKKTNDTMFKLFNERMYK